MEPTDIPTVGRLAVFADPAGAAIGLSTRKRGNQLPLGRAATPAPSGRSRRYSPDRHMGGLFAYLDPGSGSMILQAVVGGVAALAVASKFYWRRFLGFLGVRKKDNS